MTEYRHTFIARNALDALTGPEPQPWGESRRTGEDEWAGSSYPESIELVRDGYIKAVDLINVIPNVSSDDQEGPFIEWSESGSMVDVPTFLEGEPECMGELVNMPVDKPLVRIGVDAAASCNVSTESILAVGRSVLTVVESLRARGYPTEIWSCMSVQSHSGSVWDGRCLIQSAASPVHVSQIAFWVAHPSALRRAWFALCETSSLDERDTFGFKSMGGYGRPNNNWARADFDEWAPSAQFGTAAATAWISEVLGRRN